MSPGQKHRIGRQVIELTSCRQGDAAALQAAAQRWFQQQWLPTIDRVCSAQVAPDRLLRIDRLTVDLGTLPLSHLLDAATALPGMGDDAGLGERFESEFETQLTLALRQAVEVRADDEILETFLQSGALPWWADAEERDTVKRAAEALLMQPIAHWRALLGGEAGADDTRLGRLTVALDESGLSRLLERGLALRPQDAWTQAMQPVWRAALERAAALQRHPARAWHRAWWHEALAASIWPAGHGITSWWPQVLRGIAHRLALSAGALHALLRGALDACAAPGDAAALAPLWKALRQVETVAAGPADSVATRELQTPVDRLSAAGEVAAEADVVGGALDALAAADASARALAAATNLPEQQQPPSPQDGSIPPARRAQPAATALAPIWAAQRQVETEAADPADSVATRELQTPVGRLSAADDAAAGVAGSALDAPAATDASARALAAAKAPVGKPASVSAVEALYVCNAGLVLLWPFVSRFADRMGLLAPGVPVRWRDPSAAQRAAVLLQCVISGDTEPPEFQLVLNKLLCGLSLELPLALDEPLSQSEQAECEGLLVAAIANAPILRNMSVAGFRCSFGLRKGQLSARDGHWLLRVEREAYDVVIDRLPWGVSLVRMPWMPKLLQVQW